MRVHAGPANTCARSTTRMPSSGSWPSLISRPWSLSTVRSPFSYPSSSSSTRAFALAAARAPALACSGVSDILNGAPGSVSSPAGGSTCSKKPRSARCSSDSRSDARRHVGERQPQRLRRHHDLHRALCVERYGSISASKSLPADHALAHLLEQRVLVELDVLEQQRHRRDGVGRRAATGSPPRRGSRRRGRRRRP